MKDGDSVRKCLTTGVWSGFHPRCQRNLTDSIIDSVYITGFYADVCADAKATGSYAQNCVVKGGKSSFTCLGKSQCPSDYTPVCASNTKTYNNRCLMKLAGCESDRKNDTIEVARLGQCSFGTQNFSIKITFCFMPSLSLRRWNLFGSKAKTSSWSHLQRIPVSLLSQQ